MSNYKLNISAVVRSMADLADARAALAAGATNDGGDADDARRDLACEIKHLRANLARWDRLLAQELEDLG